MVKMLFAFGALTIMILAFFLALKESDGKSRQKVFTWLMTIMLCSSAAFVILLATAIFF